MGVATASPISNLRVNQVFIYRGGNFLLSPLDSYMQVFTILFLRPLKHEAIRGTAILLIRMGC